MSAAGLSKRADAERSLVLRDQPAMRTYLLESPVDNGRGELVSGSRLWADQVLEGVRRREVSSMRMFARAVGWLGAEIQVANIFLQQIGTSPENARAAWQAYSGVQHLAEDEDALAAHMEQWLTDYHRARGRRLAVLEDASA
jgi:hypothetical protein